MTPVFVYGTLKQGFPNFHVNKGTRVAGIFYTKNCYLFYLVGERHTPWLIFDENKGYQVRGQLYMVDDETLAGMDILEGIGQPDGYQKIQIPIIPEKNSSKEKISQKSVLNNGVVAETKSEIFATVYVKSIEQLKNADIQLGPLKEYEVKHTLLYKPRSTLVG